MLLSALVVVLSAIGMCMLLLVAQTTGNVLKRVWRKGDVHLSLKNTHNARSARH